MYSLGAAARATGKSKSTIFRAIKAGRVSTQRDDNGGHLIDPAELHRVFPPTVRGNQSTERTATPPAPSPEMAFLQQLLAEREETIRDLRNRLDAEAAERRNEAEERRRLLALLTDQRGSWWRRWFR